MREEVFVQLKDRTLIYEECSHGEALGSKHTIVMYNETKSVKKTYNDLR